MEDGVGEYVGRGGGGGIGGLIDVRVVYFQVQLQKDGVEFYGLAKQVQISNVNFQETTDEIL